MLTTRQEQIQISVYSSLIDSRCHRQGYTIPKSDLESLAKLAILAAKVFERVVTTKPPRPTLDEDGDPAPPQSKNEEDED